MLKRWNILLSPIFKFPIFTELYVYLRERIVIGMHVWKVECNRKFRIHKIDLQTVKSSDFIKSRHVFYRTRYCIFSSAATL